MRMAGGLLAVAAALGVSACGDDDTRKSAKADVRCSAGSSGALTARPRWRTGQRFVYELQTSRTGSGVPAGASSLNRVTVRVRGVSRAGYRLRLSIALTQGPTGTAGAELAKALAELPPLTVEYRTNRAGSIVAIEDLAALRERARRTVAVLARSTRVPSSVLRQVRRQVDSPGALQASLVQPALVMHAAYGRRLRRGGSLRIATSTQSPLGGMVRATDTYRIAQARDRGGCARIKVDTVPRPGDVDRAVRKQLGASAGALPPTRTRSAATYRFDRGSGQFVSIDLVRTTHVGDRSRADRSRYVLRSP